MSADSWRSWLKMAESNLTRAGVGRQQESILYEDICFDAQQAAEKALKGLLVFLGHAAPRTHSIGYLLRLVEEQAVIPVPPGIREAALLSDYAVTTRYPGDWEPVDEDEYLRAFMLASAVWDWVVSITDYK